MIINKVGLKATIPTGPYANIQPEIEISGCTVAEAEKVGMEFIQGMYGRFSEKGELVDKGAVSSVVSIQSYNEAGVTVEYGDENHEYFYQGKKITGATDYIKRFYKEFDAQMISGVCSKSWGVSQDMILGLWDGNRDLTASFGTVVHKALEQYDKYCLVGGKISASKGDKLNYALPAHPILKAIVLGFQSVDTASGQIETEVLITDVKKGFCGRADRIRIIDKEKKICRIQDYKINVNCEEIASKYKPIGTFANLPANKLTKYQLQMSFYANMMEAAGWTVEGLDVFVYEDTWKHFKLPVLKVI